MNAYHFVKYNENSSLDNLITQTDNTTTLCFDFEDSIQDLLSPINTPALKATYRQYLKAIVEKSKIDFAKINIGVRINAMDSPEYLLDLIFLSEVKNVSTIFIPKAESSKQIIRLQNDLQKNGVNYDKIIPTIETKNGLNNLESILKINLNKIGGIAFGHCDYNFDNSHYPFFHQDSKEYWTWIIKIMTIVKPYNLCLVNSPFLQLNNDEFFKSMLNVLYAIAGNNVAQITLTKKQSNICHSFQANQTNIVLPKILNRLDLRVPVSYDEIFIDSFEQNTHNKGFAINDKRVVLSPQEYRSSLDYQRKADFPEINFTFVGGCFPVQKNILFENLFHQLLKQKIENIKDVKFNINIIRYERFKNCITKISSYKEKNPIDILVFSIRPEPFLRLVKLYYKFLDPSTGKIRKSLNLPVINQANPEQYDLLSLETRFNPLEASDSSIIRKILVNLNYISGSLLGNDRYALLKYLDLINEIILFSRRNNIKLYILGSPIRTNTLVEKCLSQKLNKFMRKSLNIAEENFVNASDFIDNGKLLFKNGIYANEKYHKLIAKRILERILPTIDKIATPSVRGTGPLSNQLLQFGA